VAQRRGLNRPVRGVSQRRSTAWSVGVGGTGATAVSLSGVQFMGSGIVALESGLTIVRIRGLLDYFLTLATGAGDGFFGAVGIGIVEEPAFTAGIGSVPTPVTDAENETWLWHQFISMHGPVASSSEAGAASMAGRIDVDSKAMRKFDEDKRLYAAVEVTEIGTATGTLFLNTRTLFKLS